MDNGISIEGRGPHEIIEDIGRSSAQPNPDFKRILAHILERTERLERAVELLIEQAAHDPLDRGSEEMEQLATIHAELIPLTASSTMSTPAKQA